MKFKFVVQKAVLVGGIVAAAYAEACYQQCTSAICIPSGNPVDQISWADGSAHPNVYATSDWWYTPPAGGADYFTIQMASGYPNTGPGTASGFCYGPAKFQDYTGNWIYVTNWMADSVVGIINTYQPQIYIGASTSGSACSGGGGPNATLCD